MLAVLGQARLILHQAFEQGLLPADLGLQFAASGQLQGQGLLALLALGKLGADPAQLFKGTLMLLLRFLLLVDLLLDPGLLAPGLVHRGPRLLQGGPLLHLGLPVGPARREYRGPAALDVIEHPEIERRGHPHLRPSLQLLHQPVVVVGIVIHVQGVTAGGPLPHPEMAPAFLELLRRAAGAGDGTGANQLGDPLLRLIALKAAAPAIHQ